MEEWVKRNRERLEELRTNINNSPNQHRAQELGTASNYETVDEMVVEMLEDILEVWEAEFYGV